MNKQILQWGTLALAALVLAGCAATAPNGRRAPVMEYGADKKPGSSTQQPVAKKPAPVMDSEYETVTRMYIVQKGDTLSNLAQRYYKNRAKWRDIYAANRKVMKNESDIHVGMELVIP